MRSWLIVSGAVLALFALSGGGAMAEPVSSIGEVAGSWRSKSGVLTLEIRQDGTFSVTYPSATRNGVAKLIDGALVLPFSNNQGELKLGWKSGALEGSYIIDVVTGPLRVERVANKD